MRVQVQAGSLLLLAKRFDDARSLADKALAVDPRFADAHVLRANAMAGLSDLPGAVAQMQEALAIEGRAGYYANLGALQQAGGQTAEAETAFRKALEVDPRSITAHLAWANFLWATGRAAQVEAALLRGHAVDPADPTANQALATYYLATDRRAEAEPFLRRLATSQRNAAPKLALANFYVSMRRNAEAVQVLEEVALQPRHWAEARLLIASIRQGEGRTDQARAIVDEVLAKEPGSRAARLAGARLDVAARRIAPAQDTLMRLVGENARDIQAQYLLGTVLAASGKVAEATRAFEAVLEINPRAAAAQTQLARLALLRGFPADAVQRAGEAVRNAPHDPRARLMLVRGLLAERQLADAQRELAGLVTAFPTAAPVQVELGRLRLMQRALPAARQAFEAAARIDPSSLDALSGLVAVDIAEGKPVQARKRIDTRVAATPEDSATQGLAGRLLLTLGDSTQAGARVAQGRRARSGKPGGLRAARPHLPRPGPARRGHRRIRGHCPTPGQAGRHADDDRHDSSGAGRRRGSEGQLRAGPEARSPGGRGRKQSGVAVCRTRAAARQCAAPGPVGEGDHADIARGRRHPGLRLPAAVRAGAGRHTAPRRGGCRSRQSQLPVSARSGAVAVGAGRRKPARIASCFGASCRLS